MVILLTVLLAISSSAADYLENQGLSGAHKHSAKDKNKEESSDDGSILLGSEDTNENMASASSAKKSTKPLTPAKAGAGVASKPVKEKLMDLKMLAHCMDKMVLVAEEYGFNFNCPNPHYWWVYSHEGIRYIKAEFLTWTVHEKEITCKISKDGTHLYVRTKLPDRFRNIMHQRGYYGDQLVVPKSGDVMFEAGRKAISLIQEKHSMEQIKPLTKVKLPFPVLKEFADPYHELERGYGLLSYPHETARQPPAAAGADGVVPPHNAHDFFVFSVSMQSKACSHVKTNVEYRHVNMDAAAFGET